MNNPTDRQMRAAAIATYGEEGSIEIDEGAIVSRAEGNPDEGAYVAGMGLDRG